MPPVVHLVGGGAVERHVRRTLKTPRRQSWRLWRSSRTLAQLAEPAARARLAPTWAAGAGIGAREVPFGREERGPRYFASPTMTSNWSGGTTSISVRPFSQATSTWAHVPCCLTAVMVPVVPDGMGSGSSDTRTTGAPRGQVPRRVRRIRVADRRKLYATASTRARTVERRGFEPETASGDDTE
jgi:hypothetical protein